MTTPMQEPKRLTAEEFLAQLDIAPGWMLWENPAFMEVELIVKDLDGKLSSFLGPDPLTTDFGELRKFARQVERISQERDPSMTKENPAEE